MKNHKTLYENLIIQNIDLDAYDIEEGTEFENIQNVHKIFLSEYGHEVKRIGEVKAFKEWLQGLPSVLTVPFYNGEILNIAYLHGMIKANASEEDEDKFLNEYFEKLSSAFFTLKENL
jgi:hypothetical protein